MRNSIFGLALLATAMSASAGVPDGVNGTWYNPAQSGHGLSIEVIDAERALALWYSYDLDGNPLTLYLDGRIEGDSIVATAYAPTGMRFGEFDSSWLAMPKWGEVSITFDDCASATLQFAGDMVGYGSGSLPLERLATAAPKPCSLDAPDTLPAGGYSGLGTGFVDDDGRYFGAFGDSTHWTQVQGAPSYPSVVMLGVPVDHQTGRTTLQMRPLVNGWLCHIARVSPAPVSCELSSTYEVREFEFRTSEDRGVVGVNWSGPVPTAITGPETDLLLSNAYLSALGEITLTFSVDGDEPGQASGMLDIGAAGELCVRIADSGCLYQGHIGPASEDPEALAGEFELSRTDLDAGTFTGKVWLQWFPMVQYRALTLTLIGSNGDIGLALRAQGYR